jgi:hypothetical protein
MKSSDKVCKTTLPATVKLTPAEMAELVKLEKKYKLADYFKSTHGRSASRAIIIGEPIFKETHNVGIHYFCIEFDIGLENLSRNKNVSTEIAFLLFEKTCTEANLLLPQTSWMRKNILSAPAVYNDVKLFKKVFERNLLDYGRLTLVLFEKHVKDIPIDAFMVLLPEVINFPSASAYMRAISLREKEILTWVNENSPEFAGLPFLWVLKAYGFKGNLEKLNKSLHIFATKGNVL